MSTEPAPPPPIETAEAALREADREQAFWDAHADDLGRRHAGAFVAVLDGHMVATATDLHQLHQRLQDRGIDVRRTWVRFLSGDPRRLMG